MPQHLDVGSERRRGLRWLWVIGVGVLAGIAVIVVAVLVVAQRGSDRTGGLPRTADYHSLLVITGKALPDRLLLGTHEGIFRSTDGGATWTRAGLAGQDAMTLVQIGGRIWAAGHDVLANSRDGGATWHNVLPEGLPSRDVHGFAVDPSNPETLYAAIAGEGLYRSGDGGSTFEALSRDVGTDVNVLAAGPRGTLFAADTGRRVVARSPDGGRTWKSVASGSINGLAVNPGGANLVLATGSGVMRSTDGGTTWKPALVIDSGAGPVGWSRGYPNVAFVVGLDRKLLRSTDFGRTWSAVP